MNLTVPCAFLLLLGSIELSWGFLSPNRQYALVRDMPNSSKAKTATEMISSGFSFTDGEQILVSAQKPLGIVLEQDSETGTIIVSDVDPNGSAGKGGVKIGDILVAVQNASTEGVNLDDVLSFIGKGPRVINLRLIRAKA